MDPILRSLNANGVGTMSCNIISISRPENARKIEDLPVNGLLLFEFRVAAQHHDLDLDGGPVRYPSLINLHVVQGPTSSSVE